MKCLIVEHLQTQTTLVSCLIDSQTQLIHEVIIKGLTQKSGRTTKKGGKTHLYGES